MNALAVRFNASIYIVGPQSIVTINGDIDMVKIAIVNKADEPAGTIRLKPGAKVGGGYHIESGAYSQALIVIAILKFAI